MAEPAILLLENEEPLYGSAAGHEGVARGTLALSALAAGFSDLLTDPVYAGKMVCFTYPHVGNAGVVHDDMQSAGPAASAVIAREFCRIKANRLGNDTICGWMKKNNIPGIEDIDTRTVAEIVTRRGKVRAVLGTGACADLAGLERELAKPDQMPTAGTDKEYEFAGDGTKARRMRVIVYDLGVKRGFLRRLSAMGCAVTVVPAGTAASDVLGRKPDGVVLSAGPGAPCCRADVADAAVQLYGKVPLWGVGLGAGIIAQAMGVQVTVNDQWQLGHQTVIRPGQTTGEVTMQCHEFWIDGPSLETKGAKITHVNLNDGSVEGFSCKAQRVMGSLYHPEGEPGPHDSLYLFDKFYALMLKKEAANA